MGIPKVQKRKNSVNFERLEKGATGHAKRLGLYLVFGGKGESRHWSVYRADTGKLVLGYWPYTHKWRDNSGKVGRCKTCHDMIELADRISKGLPLLPENPV